MRSRYKNIGSHEVKVQTLVHMRSRYKCRVKKLTLVPSTAEKLEVASWKTPWGSIRAVCKPGRSLTLKVEPIDTTDSVTENTSVGPWGLAAVAWKDNKRVWLLVRGVVTSEGSGY